jgi:hypothetical protein
MGLMASEHSPCLFTGILIPGEPPIYVGIYVDDIIYFSASDNVEKQFENLLAPLGQVDFMGQVSLFLGTEFTWTHHLDGTLTVVLTQQSFTESLIKSLNIQSTHTSSFSTPYKLGLCIDAIPHEIMSLAARDELRLKYQKFKLVIYYYTSRLIYSGIFIGTTSEYSISWSL